MNLTVWTYISFAGSVLQQELRDAGVTTTKLQEGNSAIAYGLVNISPIPKKLSCYPSDHSGSLLREA